MTWETVMLLVAALFAYVALESVFRAAFAQPTMPVVVIVQPQTWGGSAIAFLVLVLMVLVLCLWTGVLS